MTDSSNSVAVAEPARTGVNLPKVSAGKGDTALARDAQSGTVAVRPVPSAVAVAVPRDASKAPRRVPWAAVCFFLLVVLPTIAAGYYYGVVASDQYVAETRFGVRFADLQQNDASAIFQGMPSASQIGLASTAIIQYLQSREIVDVLQERLNLRAMYANPMIDPLSRLSPDATIEQLVDYWRGKVDPFFDLNTGAVSVRVKAFSPADAQAITTAILSLSEALVNDMSLKSREQAIKMNKDEVAAAEVRLQKAREEMTAFRNGQAVIDASKEAESRLTVVTKLRGDLAELQGEMTRQRSYLSEDAPTVKDLQHQIAAVRGQLALAEGQLTSKDTPGASSGANPLSGSIGGYEALAAKTGFAQRYYDSMLEALLKAQEDAARQLSYLAVFVHPALPQSALYPRRAQDTILVFLVSGGLWMLLLLGYRALREHVI